MKEIIKVINTADDIVVDENNVTYKAVDNDIYESQETGVLYKVYEKDEIHNVIAITDF